MSNGCASPSPLAATVRILFLSTNSSLLPSGEKLGESPSPTLCGTPPAVATTHTSFGIGPSGELLTLTGVSSQRFSPRVKAIDFASGDQARSPILKPSHSLYGVIWRAFAPWEGSATQILRQPFESNTHATAEPVGAGTMSYGNGACITSLSVKAAGWAPAACVINRAAQTTAAVQSRNFPKPKSIMCLLLWLFRIWYPLQKQRGLSPIYAVTGQLDSDLNTLAHELHGLPFRCCHQPIRQNDQSSNQAPDGHMKPRYQIGPPARVRRSDGLTLV